MEGVETISKTLAISTFCLLGTLLVVYQNRDGLRELLGSIAVPSQDQSSTLQTIE